MSYSPSSPSAYVELLPLFRQMLEMCRIEPDERVLIFSSPQTRPQYVAASVGAAMGLGADVGHLTIPGVECLTQQTQEDQEDHGESLTAMAWQMADMVIDLSQGFWPGYMKILELACSTGTRTLCITEPVDVLMRTFPSDRDKTRALASKALLERGGHLRMMSEAGTDLILNKTGRSVTMQYGYADEPGHWDRWGRVHVATAPLEDSATGVVVLKPGDIIVPLGRYLSESICLTLRDGRIVDIEGDGADAYLLRDWFAQWRDPNAYIVSHIGWGLQDRSDWSRMGVPWMETGGLNEVKGFSGSIPIAFGHNANFILRGENVTKAHLDITCRDCSLYVDDQLVLEQGQLISEELR